MSGIVTSKILSGLQKVWQPQVQTVRFRYWKDYMKNPRIDRFGYDDDIMPTGLLPRGHKVPLKTAPIFRVKDTWSEKRALFGQNDYIDILGHEQLHPSKLMYDVPQWLKGFRGNEFEMLMRKMKKFPEIQYSKPMKWSKMRFQLNKSYYFFNYRKKVGHVKHKEVPPMHL